MFLNFFENLFFLGISQGLFLTLLIFQKRLFANYFLGTLTLTLSLMQLGSFICIAQLYSVAPYPYIMPYLVYISLLIFPLFYLYTRYLISRFDTLRKKDLLHFLPFLSFRLLYVFLEHTLCPTVTAIFKIQGIVYLSLAFYSLKYHAVHIKQMFSSVEKLRLNWLQYINYMLIIFLGMYIFEDHYGPLYTLSPCFKFYITDSLVTTIVYVMGYIGFFKSAIFSDPEVSASLRQTPQLTAAAPSAGRRKGKKYQKSGLTDETAREYLQQLRQFMETHKSYRENDLTLSQLAGMLNISPYHLSEIINFYLKQNFFEFINQYRLEEVKKELRDPEKQHLTILAIAMQAGFNSKTTFNTFFKKHTRMPPFVYRKQMQKRQGERELNKTGL